MKISNLLNPPSHQPQQVATQETAAHPQSAGASASAADKGKQAASVSHEEHVAVMASRDKGARHRLSPSPNEWESASKLLRSEEGDDRSTPPAAPSQARSSFYKPVGPDVSTVSGWRAFTAARRSSLTSPQTREESPAASRSLPSSPQSSADAVQAMVQRQAEQGAAQIPECYRDMAHWEESMKGMVATKKASGRLQWFNEEKVALVEYFRVAGKSRTAFCRDILGVTGAISINDMLDAVNAMEAAETLPQPWRPSPDAASQNPPDSAIPECYPDMAHWEQSVKGMVETKRASGRHFWHDNEKAALAEIVNASNKTKAVLCHDIATSWDALNLIVRTVEEMKADGTLPQPWRPSSDDAS